MSSSNLDSSSTRDWERADLGLQRSAQPLTGIHASCAALLSRKERLVKRKYLLLVAAFVCMSWLPATGYAADASGQWVAKVMGSKIRAFVEQHGTRLSGLAKVRASNGKNATYHFVGTINGNQIQVAHHNGHSFSGVLTGPKKMEGVLTTRGGHSVSITATRK